MGTPDPKLRVTEAATDALKRVVVRFPRFSQTQLADAIIIESCDAILADRPEKVAFPTVEYIRSQIHPKGDRPTPVPPVKDDRVIVYLQNLGQKVDALTTRLNEEPDIGPPGKKRAR